ncbi:MAG: hypothetical protein RR773_02940, partial [Raoultibacter sp.]
MTDDRLRSHEAVIVGALRHTTTLGSDELGVITRIDNVIKKIATDLDMSKRSLEDTEKQIENVKAENCQITFDLYSFFGHEIKRFLNSNPAIL